MLRDKLPKHLFERNKMNFTNPSIEIIKSKSLYIFDMDGTVYLGARPFGFAKRFISNLKRAGKRVREKEKREKDRDRQRLSLNSEAYGNQD